MPTITAHCLVKNEENFVGYAIRSVVDFVDKIIVFDTGSTDKTVRIVQELAVEYPHKILFEEKGECDKQRHTQLRQEMLDRTTTDWFMVLDGDEVWTKRGMEEVSEVIANNNSIECLVAPFYLCVGDIYHRYYKRSNFRILNRVGSFSPRIIQKTQDIHWSGAYGNDTLLFGDGSIINNLENTLFLKHKYWHLTNLPRSSFDHTDFSSNGNRSEKRRITHFLIGRKIKDKIPEVFGDDFYHLGHIMSVINFLKLLISKVRFLNV